MTNPEISRRCRFCGVSIRERALFCPQCGKELGEGEQPASALLAPEITTNKTTAPLDAPETGPPPASMSDTIAIDPAPRSMSDTIAIERPAAAPQSDPKPRPRGAVGARLQRATTLARGVEGDVKHRVQKVREISSVVIDEAGYDPSLRFVLVAVALFLLFLLIVLLNKFIT